VKKFLILAVLASIVSAGCGAHPDPALGAPTVTGISPTLGARSGGLDIVITGTNFTPTTIITLADTAIIDLTYVDPNTMTGKTPPAEGGTNAGLVVSNSSGVGFMLGAFYYIPPPSIAGLNPKTSEPTGLIPVTITGKGFTEYDAGVNTVLFGVAPATNVVAENDTTIKCICPPGLGVTDVTVSNTNGSATKIGGFQYFPPPTIATVTPAEGTPLGGTMVTITGSGFEFNFPGPNTVNFGGFPATDVTVVDDGTITCKTPVQSGTVDVSVSNANGTAVKPAGFFFYPTPTVTAISPDTGTSEGGDPVTITGTGFQDYFPGTNTVAIGGVNCTSVNVVSDTTITCVTAPMPVGTLSVTVANNNGIGTLATIYESKLSALLGSDGSDLYKVDTSNGSTTSIGSHGASIVGMATHPDGTIYAISTSKLYTIDPSTGGANEVASLSQTMNNQTDLTFKGTTLYAGNYQGYTYSIDLNSGSVTSKQRNPYYYYGVRKTGLHYDSNTSRWAFMTYDGYYCFHFDPDVGGYPSYTTGLSTHAVRTIGVYQGTIYGIDTQAGTSGGTLYFVRFGSGFSSTTRLGTIGPSLIALTGTD
jgi:hypothetical protein